MAANYKIGQEVKLITIVPQGPVVALSVNQEGDIVYKVSYADSQGVAQERWFKENDLEAV